MRDAPSVRRMRSGWSVLALLVLMAVALATSLREQSPTTDESLHMTRGLAYFWGPDASLSYAHPPLGNALAMLPTALRAKPVAIGKMSGFDRGLLGSISYDLLKTDYEARRQWIFEGRGMVALMTVLLGWYVFTFCAAVWDRRSALIALFFYATLPTLIAHGGLLTTDMPVTVAMTIALGELVLYVTGKARFHLWTCALATGAALATKFTAVALLPVAALVLGGAAWFGVGRFAGVSRLRALRKAGVVLALIGVCGVFSIDAAYRFEDTGLTVKELLARREPVNAVTAGYRGSLLEKSSPLPRLPSWLPIPLPYTYVFGMASVKAHDHDGHGTTFFGKFMTHGSPAYFPVLLLAKTPLLLLCALGVGAFSLLWRRRMPSATTLALLAFSAVMLGLAMKASINIGVRHVLPLMPIMAMLGGRAVSLALDEPWLPSERGAYLGGLAALQVLGLWLYHPDYLADFNLLVGGKRGGEKISIVGEEWGQDMMRLGEALRAHGIRSVRYNTDTGAARLELARYGIETKKLGCLRKLPRDAYVAVNARDAARDHGRCYRWITKAKPLLDVNGHVFVYRSSKAKAKSSAPAEPVALRPPGTSGRVGLP